MKIFNLCHLILIGAMAFGPAVCARNAQRPVILASTTSIADEKPPEPTKIGDIWVRPRDGARMVAVPAGPFLMGSDAGPADQKPQHTVTLDGYWIDETPVTVAQYRIYCDVVGKDMPAAPRWGWKEDQPIVNINYDDAIDYTKWVRAELPTEAQWEKAARGTDGRRFPWGDDFDRTRLQCSNKGYGDAGGTASVMAHPTGKSPYGAFDMAGNVWEWCSDWYGADYYTNSPDHNPTGSLTGNFRVVKGGPWVYFPEVVFHSAYRGRGNPATRDYSFGFRCVVRPAPADQE